MSNAYKSQETNFDDNKEHFQLKTFSFEKILFLWGFMEVLNVNLSWGKNG